MEEVFAKKENNRKRVLKGLIAELAVASGSNSISIIRIRDAFQAQNSKPRLLTSIATVEHTAGGLRSLSKRFEAMAITLISGGRLGGWPLGRE